MQLVDLGDLARRVGQWLLEGQAPAAQGRTLEYVWTAHGNHLHHCDPPARRPKGRGTAVGTPCFEDARRSLAVSALTTSSSPNTMERVRCVWPGLLSVGGSRENKTVPVTVGDA